MTISTETFAYDGRSHKYVSENRTRYVAQSILHGFVPDPLPATVAEAEDIIRWHEASTHRPV